jgi:hypothetical protein
LCAARLGFCLDSSLLGFYLLVDIALVLLDASFEVTFGALDLVFALLETLTLLIELCARLIDSLTLRFERAIDLSSPLLTVLFDLLFPAFGLSRERIFSFAATSCGRE